jgi:hypothetical protein
MLAHQKLFLMMQNKFVQKKPPEKQKKKIGDSIS